MADGTATFPRNDIESLCKTQVAGAAATLPQRGEGISNYNQIIDENRPSPQPIGEGAKPTYSQNMIRPLTLALSHKGRGKSTSLFTPHFT